jgi:flagellar biosynthesis regulator FlaF
MLSCKDDISNKKCYSCNKLFPTPSHLEKHKTRKTPCLIREIDPKHINNPNRCIFCNKIFSNKDNLKKHLKLCKIKNGGLEILEDKTRHEQEIRILKEKDVIRDKESEEYKQKIIEMEQTMKIRDELIINMMQKIQAGLEKNTPHVINNQVNINQVNVTINGYLSPNIDHLLKDDFFKNFFLKHGVSTPTYIVPEIWLNPAIPDNITAYIVNSQKETMTCYNGKGWKISTMDAVCEEIRDLSYEITANLINFPLSVADQMLPGRMKINRDDPEQLIIETKMIKQKFVENMEMCRLVGKKNHAITF